VSIRSAVLTALISVSATAQTVPLVVPASQPNILHVGTSIALETRDKLTTENKALTVGQRIEMAVAQPVMLNGQVAIAAGTRAFGEITSVRNKGMWGKSGGFTGRYLYIDVGGRQIRLNGSFSDRGETGTLGVLASVAFVPIAGFFVTGTSADIAPGTRVMAFLAEEVPVVFSDTQPAPPIVAPIGAALQSSVPTSTTPVTPPK
jgi:hypothetical protein